MTTVHTNMTNEDWISALKDDPDLGRRVLVNLNKNKSELVALSGSLFPRKISNPTLDKLLEGEPLRRATLERVAALFAAMGIATTVDPTDGARTPVIPDEHKLSGDVPVMRPKKAVFSRTPGTEDALFTRVRLRAKDVDAITEHCQKNGIRDRFSLIEQALQIGFHSLTNERLPSDTKVSAARDLKDCGLTFDFDTTPIGTGLTLDDAEPPAPVSGLLCDQE